MGTTAVSKENARTSRIHRWSGPGAPAWLLLGVLYPLVRVVLAVTQDDASLQVEFKDDAFYYAVIAENIADGDGSTFGGLVRTNGYQPLWQLLLVPLALVADGDALLRLMYVLEGFCFAVTVLVAWLIARRLDAALPGAYAFAYVGAVALVGGNVFFGGMEIAVVLPLLLGTIYAALRWLGPGSQGLTVRAGIGLGALCFALAMARLDALAFPAALALVLLVRGRLRTHLRGQVAGAVTLVAGLAAYAVLNVLAFDTPLPVSGQAKAVGGGGLDPLLFDQFLTFGRTTSTVSFPIPTGPLYLGLQSLVLAGVALHLLSRARWTDRPLFGAAADRQLTELIVALLLAQAVQIGYYTATTSWMFWEWYLYYIPVLVFLPGVVIVRAATGTRLGAVLRLPAIAVVAAVIAVAVGGTAVRATALSSPWMAAAVGPADWIRENTDPSDVIAVGDRGGYVSWLTGRPTLQLEGLVEDADYLDVIEERGVADHMDAVGVDYYLRGVVPSAAREGCTTVVEPVQGRGPKSPVTVCSDDLVYTDTHWRIWRRGG